MLAILFILNCANAQFNGTPTPNDTLHLTQFLPNGDVLLRIYVSGAKDVSSGGDIVPSGEQLKKTKADNGFWAINIPNVKPGTYRYAFVVDGIAEYDPKSLMVKETRQLLKSPAKKLVFER